MRINVASDTHGIKLQTRRATRYVSRGLVGTLCETVAIRQVVHAGKPNAAAVCATRAPSDWPETYGCLETRIEAHAV
jgi:hypothetical protein